MPSKGNSIVPLHFINVHLISFSFYGWSHAGINFTFVYHVLTGLVTIHSIASGQKSAQAVTRSLTIQALVSNQSWLVTSVPIAKKIQKLLKKHQLFSTQWHIKVKVMRKLQQNDLPTRT